MSKSTYDRISETMCTDAAHDGGVALQSLQREAAAGCNVNGVAAREDSARPR